jgi:hypothetical protein
MTHTNMRDDCQAAEPDAPQLTGEKLKETDRSKPTGSKEEEDLWAALMRGQKRLKVLKAKLIGESSGGESTESSETPAGST